MCRFQRGRPSAPARKLAWFEKGRWAAATSLRRGLRRPCYQSKGFHPLTLFRWRNLLGLSQSAVSIADCFAAARKLSFFPFFLCFVLRPGCRPNLLRGHRPLTLFRWRDSLEYALSVFRAG